MLALYRSGRQAEALEAYSRRAATLVEELGLEPSPELQRLEQAILRHDPALDAPLAAGSRSRSAPEQRIAEDRHDPLRRPRRLDRALAHGSTPRSLRQRAATATSTRCARSSSATAARSRSSSATRSMAVFGVPAAARGRRAARRAGRGRAARSPRRAERRPRSATTASRIQLRIGDQHRRSVRGRPASGQPFATGDAVNVAMRLQQAALAGRALLGAATTDSCATPRRPSRSSRSTSAARSAACAPSASWSSGPGLVRRSPRRRRCRQRGRARSAAECIRPGLRGASQPRASPSSARRDRQDAARRRAGRRRLAPRRLRSSDAASPTARAPPTCRSRRSSARLCRSGHARRSFLCSRATRTRELVAQRSHRAHR